MLINELEKMIIKKIPLKKERDKMRRERKIKI